MLIHPPGMSEELINALQDAILDLQLSLQKLGSNLAIRTGRTADVLLDIANEVSSVQRFSSFYV